MSDKPTKKDCAGCRDNVYNHQNFGGNMKNGHPECWSLESATFVSAIDIPIDLRPPYKGMAETVRPSCYKANSYVRVKPDRLTAEGFWR